MAEVEIAVSLVTMLMILVAAYSASRVLLPKSASSVDRFSFVWLVFDGLTHSIVEGSFVYYSIFGRTVANSKPTNAFAASLVDSWIEYARSRADARWAVADATVVSLELLTVFGCGPLCFLIAAQICRNNPVRHFWLTILNTSELYGGFMTFAPECTLGLTGSPNLSTDNFLHLWVYLAFFNLLWVVIPLYLLYDSFEYLSSALAQRQKGD